jgi:hypothetical protein
VALAHFMDRAAGGWDSEAASSSAGVSFADLSAVVGIAIMIGDLPTGSYPLQLRRSWYCYAIWIRSQTDDDS